MKSKAQRHTILKHTLRKNLVIIPVLIFFSCDCHRIAEGVVLDIDSRLPIRNVQIVNIDDFTNEKTDHLEISDDKGKFSYSDISGGLFRCPELVLVFTKEGYNIKRTSFESENKADTIYMKTK